MTRYVASRIGQAVLVLWAAFTLSFILLQAMPGDAVLIKFLSPDYGLSPDQIKEIRAAYAVDSSVFVQYFHTLANFLQGDFGYSLHAGVPVTAQLAIGLPATLTLAALAFLAAIVLAVFVAVLSSLAPFSFLRNLVQAVPSLLISVPVFWLGIMLIQIFSFRLKLVSVINPGPWESLVLPVITLSVPIAAPLAQILIRNIDEIRTRPFISVVIAKGATPARVLWRHVAINAALPVLTIAGVLFGELLAGAVVTETVFGLNGLGELTEKAVSTQDIAVLQAIVVISATAFVIINLLVDLAYPLLDPRLRSRNGAAS
ncbi:MULTISPECIES: ABC transporter permease [Rhizobium/Agrobacterium group]|uniref:ABC transporter membrane spanning protein (Dipeptide) n=2 Tax=Rhizobium/Agrobacterium group TaxID=227290 RepID=B9K4T1_ALLAM|nr:MULTISPECIES: ABC transporter permease [Rhizobium/Agrobacterium group]ACM39879.1 ABC transporter membrane spanning protein (dipeptide) [Allorhizobium ampelinum S4]MCF1447994.1 ABC transporter permease [Allorhizobium ampelinum]MCF1495248.1 ABC transporter permease [Allorhizobium ampelinum]MUO28632.1 ABC transporter permease subunit [Agrobacterium vitis]MUO41533.1 ABC transporter permease subunit [Agrobacterium vitis]